MLSGLWHTKVRIRHSQFCCILGDENLRFLRTAALQDGGICRAKDLQLISLAGSADQHCRIRREAAATRKTKLRTAAFPEKTT